VSNGGKKVIEHYQSITQKLFVNVDDLKWSDTNDNVKLLGESVKNCITVFVSSAVLSCFVVYLMSRMKKAYIKHRANISETGQGLLDAGQEDDIIVGSEIANVWRKSSHY
jgi:hypothetical protein